MFRQEPFSAPPSVRAASEAPPGLVSTPGSIAGAGTRPSQLHGDADALPRNVLTVRMRPAEFFARVLAHQLCTTICQNASTDYNARRLLDGGCKLLCQAFGLWDVFLKPDSGHADAVNLCWDQDPILEHPHALGADQFMTPVKSMRLQLHTIARPDWAAGGCCPLPSASLQMCTVVISTQPEHSASVQTFMGGEAPGDAPFLDCTSESAESLTVAVYHADTCIAHAVIPLQSVWEAVVDGKSLDTIGAYNGSSTPREPSHQQHHRWPGPATPWPGESPPRRAPAAPSAQHLPLHHHEPRMLTEGAEGRATAAASPRQRRRKQRRCPYCRSWFSRFFSALVCSKCQHCMGTRVYRDPFRSPALSDAFDRGQVALKEPKPDVELAKVDGPLWWLSKAADGQPLLHATLTDPGHGKLACVVALRAWKVEGEVPALGRFHGMDLPFAGPSLPAQQVQLSVMQLYRITMQSSLTASGCNPRKLTPDEPWSWLLGQFIHQHHIPASSVHLCWLQWYLQEDIRSLLPEALELIKNKLDTLRVAGQMDGFERTQLDALQLDALRLIEFSFQRYYRLDSSAERGLCERQARSTERCPGALKPAVGLAHILKDLCHPQDQAWLRHLFADAALNRFKHLEAAAGLRPGGTMALQTVKSRGMNNSVDELRAMDTRRESPYEVNGAILLRADSWSRPPAGFTKITDMKAWMEQNRLDKDQLTVSLATLCDSVKRELDADLCIHREHVLPSPVILPVVAAEVYCKSLSNLVVYLLDNVRPDATAAATNTVVAIARLENYLRKSIFAAFQQEQPFSAHTLLESTVRRWLERAKADLLGQIKASAGAAAGGRVTPGPTPSCELQDQLVPALRNRLRAFESIVTHLPLTVTMVEKMATDVIRESVLESCKQHGVVRQGRSRSKSGLASAADDGVDVAAHMRRDGWVWHVRHCDLVRNTGLRLAEIVMLNSLRRLLSNIAAINWELGKWSGSDALPQLFPVPRINVFGGGRGAGGPPTGLADGSDRAPSQGDLYSSPSMKAGRAAAVAATPRTGGLQTSDLGLPLHLPAGGGYTGGGACEETPLMLPQPPAAGLGPYGHGTSSALVRAHATSPRADALGGFGGPGSPHGMMVVAPEALAGASMIPYGVNFAQLNQEVRHIYSFVVIETARRIGDAAIKDAGGMLRVVDSASATVPQVFLSPYAVAPPAGDARMMCAQRLHENLQKLLQGMRRVLEDKAFIALTRGLWDHMGHVAYLCLQQLRNGGEDPRAWRTQQGVEQMLADLEDFFKQNLQSFVQDSSLVPRDLSAPARFVKAKELVSSAMGSNSFQPI